VISAEELLRIFEKRPRRFKLLDKGLALLKIDENQTWLEIGCNNGDAISHLVDIYKIKGIGVDYNSNAIKNAKLKLDKNIELQPFRNKGGTSVILWKSSQFSTFSSAFR